MEQYKQTQIKNKAPKQLIYPAVINCILYDVWKMNTFDIIFTCIHWLVHTSHKKHSKQNNIIILHILSVFFVFLDNIPKKPTDKTNKKK